MALDVVCGMDEAGRGMLAGPGVAAAVIRGNARVEGLRDSKRRTVDQREELAGRIAEECLGFAYGVASVEEIAEVNHRPKWSRTRQKFTSYGGPQRQSTHPMSVPIECGPAHDPNRQVIFSNRNETRRKGERRVLLEGVKASLLTGLFLVATLSSCYRAPVWPPLTEAIRSGDTEEAKRLIESGARLSSIYYADPLIWSIGFAHDEITRLLIARGADVNSVSRRGTTPLIRAAAIGNPEIVRILIDAGASVNPPDAMEADPLICSVGNHEVMQMLIDAGADVNKFRKQGGTPLDVAAIRSDHVSMRILLDNGADPNRHPMRKRVHRRKSCTTPYSGFGIELEPERRWPRWHVNSVLGRWLDWSHLKGRGQHLRFGIARRLLDAGATVELDAMAVAARTGDIEMLKLLLAVTGDASMENRHGGTVLHAVYYGVDVTCAVVDGTGDAVRILIEHGADPNRVGALEYFGPCGVPTDEPYSQCTRETCVPITPHFTPLMWIAKGHGKVPSQDQLRHAELLLDMGADPALAGPRGTNAMMVAAWYGNVDFIKMLVERGADPTLKDKMGRNALMYAAESRELGRYDSLSYLLDIGLDPNIADMNGNTPLIWEARIGSTGGLIKLLRHGANPNVANNMGQTALMFSASHMSANLFTMLHEAGADLYATDNEGNTFLHYLIPLCGKLKQRGCSLTTPVRDYVKKHGINIAFPLSEKRGW